jgi:hypothetical protein
VVVSATPLAKERSYPLRCVDEGVGISPGLEVIPESSAMKERACPLRYTNDRGRISLRSVVVSETLERK